MLCGSVCFSWGLSSDVIIAFSLWHFHGRIAFDILVELCHFWCASVVGTIWQMHAVDTFVRGLLRCHSAVSDVHAGQFWVIVSSLRDRCSVPVPEKFPASARDIWESWVGRGGTWATVQSRVSRPADQVLLCTCQSRILVTPMLCCAVVHKICELIEFELKFNIPLDIKWVILEMLFPASIFASTEEAVWLACQASSTDMQNEKSCYKLHWK